MTKEIDRAVKRTDTLLRMLKEAQDSAEATKLNEPEIEKLTEGIFADVRNHNDKIAMREMTD